MNDIFTNNSTNPLPGVIKNGHTEQDSEVEHQDCPLPQLKKLIITLT